MSSNSSRRTATPKGERSRATILQAAIPLFAEQGYRGASLASVAGAAGLTQAGLLHHFPSKEDLLLHLLDERDRDDGRRLSGMLAEEGLAFVNVLEALVEHNQTTPELVRLFTTLVAEGTSRDHPAHDYFVARYERIRRRVARSLREGQRSGEIREDIDIDAFVPVILAVMDGLQIQWLLNPELDMVASFDAFAQFLRAQLAAPPSQNGSGPARS
jgi:AcrR family transcriptional regulator